MAKKSGKSKKSKETSGRQGSPARPPIYMVVVGLAAAAWVIWRLEPRQGLGMALLAGAIVFGAWFVFVLLTNRSSRQGNDD